MTEGNMEIVQRYVEQKKIDEKKMLECLEGLLEKSESIGEGQNAEVFALNDHELSNLCAKRMKRKPQINSNSVEQEFGFQQQVHRMGIKTPLILYAVESEDRKLIVMERIFGSTVGALVRREAEPPEHFNHETFFDKLEAAVEKMHEANVYHRDLHMDNVMVDEAGEPVIIDFGTATFDFDEHSAYRDPVYMLNQATGRYEPVIGYYKNDLMQVADMKQKLRK